MNLEEAKENIPCGRYRHYKGGEYEIFDHGIHSETEEVLVIYKALYDEQKRTWIRPASMFVEMVNGVKRFQKI